MVTSSIDTATSTQWKTFIAKSLRTRLTSDQFDKFARLLNRESSASSYELSRFLLESQAGAGAIDPLFISYVQCLLHLRVILGHDLLAALLAFSPTKSKAAQSSPADVKTNGSQNHVSLELEGTLVNALTLQCTDGNFPKSLRETAETLATCSGWMNTLVDLNHRDMLQDVSQAFQPPDAQTLIACEALARFVVALSNISDITKDLNSKISRDVVKQFGKSLSAFTQLLSTVSVPLANRLELFQQSQDALRPTVATEDGEASGNAAEFAEMECQRMVDRQFAYTRGHMVVFLDSMLSSLPRITDDEAMAYIHSHFVGDYTSMCVHLIACSFDLLAIASARGDTSSKIFLYQAFICNKLPLFISSISSLAFTSFVPLSLPSIVTQAFARLDYHGLDGVGSDQGPHVDSSLMSDVQKKFVLACKLNGIITDREAKQLAPTIEPAPIHERVNRNSLAQECAENPSKVEQIAKDLENATGDAAEYASVLVQSMRDLCSSRDTMALKSLCLLLCQRPHAIDMIFLFHEPGSVLGPISQVLDEWKYDDHQGEYQPVYEEFSACLLFLLLCVDRYQLSASQVDLQPDSQFVSWLLDISVVTRPVKTLDEEQGKQLAGWANSLFSLEAISDDVMSICPPQDFYKLVPTIFSQTFLARRLDILSTKALESGTELLLEPFLLPCIILGIQYLEEYTWQRQEGSSTTLPFLRKLLLPSSKSDDGLALHNAVLSIVKPRLIKILQRIPTNDATSQEDRGQLRGHIDKIKENCRYREPLPQLLHSPELRNTAAIDHYRSIFDSICSWSMPAASLVGSLPTYSHRDLLALLRLCGATKVLETTLDALIAYVPMEMADFPLDIATAVICAGTISSRDFALPQLSAELHLQKALKHARGDVAKLVSVDRVRAEAIVLLHRRVEERIAAVENSRGQGLGIPTSGMVMNMAALDSTGVDIDMMNMDTLETAQDEAQVPSVTQDISSIDFAPDSQTIDLTGSFDMALDPAFAEQAIDDMQAAAEHEGQHQSIDRRASIDDIWTGLDTDDLDFT